MPCSTRLLSTAAAGSVACYADSTTPALLLSSHPAWSRSADADLALLSKRAPPPGAWQGKVVWIVGASQVRPLAWPTCAHQTPVLLACLQAEPAACRGGAAGPAALQATACMLFPPSSPPAARAGLPPVLLGPQAAQLYASDPLLATPVRASLGNRLPDAYCILSCLLPPANACLALQGLGEALARYWAAAGARLVLSSRSMEKLQARGGGGGWGRALRSKRARTGHRGGWGRGTACPEGHHRRLRAHRG